jgi:hypothetical protein
MAARFGALGDDQVAAAIHGLACLLCRAHLPASQRPAGVDQANQVGVGGVIEELHQLGPPGGQLHVVGVVPVKERQQEVDPERAGLGLLELGDAVGQGGQGAMLEHAQPHCRTEVSLAVDCMHARVLELRAGEPRGVPVLWGVRVAAGRPGASARG